MLIFWQSAAFVAIVALTVAWGNWVWETHKTIKAPISLGEVVVHGVDAEQVEATARALALGVAGNVAEHYRTVDFINAASRTAGETLIVARGAAPEPLLLQSKDEAKRLDITVEFAGAKLDSKGLTTLFQRSRPPRGGLSLSVSLLPGKSETDWKAFASASFPENSVYGFQTEAEGTVDAIAKTIGLRFVQAHYSVDDPFFAAISGSDFTELWDVRREAAEMALRSISSDAEGAQALREEARKEYLRIQHLLSRYRRRHDLQRLGAFLAQVADELERARSHAEAARDSAKNDVDRLAMTQLLVALKLEIANRESQSTVAATSTTDPGETFDQTLERLRRANDGVIETLRLAELEANYPANRKPRIGLVLGVPNDSWLPRVKLLGSGGGKDEFLAGHTSSILSLFASFAPEAELIISPVGGMHTAPGAVTNEEIDSALASLAAEELDAIYLDFGVSARSFGTVDGAEQWKAANVANLKTLTGFEGLAVFPAGNDDVEVPAVPAPQGGPAFAIIGSEPHIPIQRYSNHGPGVDFLVPGEVTTLGETNQLVPQRGTSMSGAIFAAGVARLAATLEEPPGGDRIRQAVTETAVQLGDGRRPDFAAAAEKLVAAGG